jgi:hypothetical protein
MSFEFKKLNHSMTIIQYNDWFSLIEYFELDEIYLKRQIFI